MSPRAECRKYIFFRGPETARRLEGFAGASMSLVLMLAPPGFLSNFSELSGTGDSKRVRYLYQLGRLDDGVLQCIMVVIVWGFSEVLDRAVVRLTAQAIKATLFPISGDRLNLRSLGLRTLRQAVISKKTQA